MVVANRYRSHESLSAVRSAAPLAPRVRSRLDLIQARVAGAHDLRHPSSDDGYAFFELWEAAPPQFDSWDVFPFGFSDPARYVVMEHVEPYSWGQVEHWAKLLKLFQRGCTLHLSIPYGETSHFMRLSIEREKLSDKFGISYYLPRSEDDEEILCHRARSIVREWKVDELLTIRKTRYRDRDGFLVSGRDESVEVSMSEYPRPSEPWFPLRMWLYAFVDEREPLEKTRHALRAFPVAPEDLRVLGQVELNDFNHAAGRFFEAQPTWNFSWTGRYKKGFDPLVRPANLHAPLRYPLLVSKAEGNSLALQVDMVHAPDRSFLEFQSAKGFDYLGSLLDELKMPYERWEGPFASRWNLVDAGRIS